MVFETPKTQAWNFLDILSSWIILSGIEISEIDSSQIGLILLLIKFLSAEIKNLVLSGLGTEVYKSPGSQLLHPANFIWSEFPLIFEKNANLMRKLPRSPESTNWYIAASRIANCAIRYFQILYPH